MSALRSLFKTFKYIIFAVVFSVVLVAIGFGISELELFVFKLLKINPDYIVVTNMGLGLFVFIFFEIERHEGNK